MNQSIQATLTIAFFVAILFTPSVSAKSVANWVKVKTQFSVAEGQNEQLLLDWVQKPKEMEQKQSSSRNHNLKPYQAPFMLCIYYADRKDTTNVEKWCKDAAINTLTQSAQTLYGYLYFYGKYGLKKNDKEAFKWLAAEPDLKSARYKDVMLQLRLRLSIEDRRNILVTIARNCHGQFPLPKEEKWRNGCSYAANPEDDFAAFGYYKQAADLGHIQASLLTAGFYQRGISMPRIVSGSIEYEQLLKKDLTESEAYYQKAIDLGHYEAYGHLAKGFNQSVSLKELRENKFTEDEHNSNLVTLTKSQDALNKLENHPKAGEAYQEFLQAERITLALKLGETYYQLKDYDLAMKHLVEAAKSGSPAAIATIADIDLQNKNTVIPRTDVYKYVYAYYLYSKEYDTDGRILAYAEQFAEGINNKDAALLREEAAVIASTLNYRF